MEIVAIILASLGFTAIVGTICVGLYFMFKTINIHFRRWSRLKLKSMRLNNDLTKSTSLSEKYQAGMKKIEYSDKYLDFLKDLIVKIVSLNFKTFKDNHLLNKVTQQHMKSFIEETATQVKLVINNDEYIDLLMYSSTYCDKFIVDAVIATTKNLLENQVDREVEIQWDQLNF